MLDEAECLFVTAQKRNVINTRSLLHSPMDTAAAFRCWPDLTKQVVVALKELHGIGLAHLDVRLPNICFNEEFQV